MKEREAAKRKSAARRSDEKNDDKASALKRKARDGQAPERKTQGGQANNVAQGSGRMMLKNAGGAVLVPTDVAEAGMDFCSGLTALPDEIGAGSKSSGDDFASGTTVVSSEEVLFHPLLGDSSTPDCLVCACAFLCAQRAMLRRSGHGRLCGSVGWW